MGAYITLHKYDNKLYEFSPIKNKEGGRGVWSLPFRPPSPDAISVRIFSNRHRQLVKAKFGSPATRARQPIFGSKSNFLPLFRKAERQKRAFPNFNLLEI